MSLEILSKTIRESSFQDFLNTYGFREICRGSDENDGRHTNYMIGYESDTCKLMIFYQTGGSIGLNIGTPKHDFSLEPGYLSWVDAKQFLAYFQRKPWIIHSSKQIMLIDVFKEYLDDVVNDLKQHDQTIFSMFSSQEVFESWFPQMREYIKSDLRRRYGGA